MGDEDGRNLAEVLEDPEREELSPTADLGGERLPLELAGGRDLLAVGVLEHLAEHAALVVADRLVDRDRLLEQPAAHLLDLVERHLGRLRQLLAGGLAAELAGEL
ncbi:MAG TPA: hypothetical protein VFK02_13480, partial [Kofleriaceae bacterium]|nr:hypothetical protein [Kofleriaceae bacterium]